MLLTALEELELLEAFRLDAKRQRCGSSCGGSSCPLGAAGEYVVAYALDREFSGT